MSQPALQTPPTSTLRSNFTLIRPPLGTGSFGSVFKAIKNKTPSHDEFDITIFTIQSQHRPSLETTFALKLVPRGLLKEVVAMAKLCHPNILPCYNVWVEDDQDLIDDLLLSSPEDDSCDCANRSSVLEVKERTTLHHLPTLLVLQLQYCEEKTLEHWITQKKGLAPNGESEIIFAQLVDALVYLQTKNMVHGDIKLNNILLTRSREGRLISKLGDFGLSNHHAHQIVRTNEHLDEEGDLEKTYVANRLRFTCPQQARLEFLKVVMHETVTGASHKNDVYSLGLVWICLLVRFKDIGTLRGVVVDAMAEAHERKSLPSELEANFPQELKLISKMIDWDVGWRPDANEVQKFLESKQIYQLPSDSSQSKRREIESMMEISEKVLNSEIEELHPNLKPLKRKQYQFLIEIISQVERHLDPIEDSILWWTAIELFNLYEDGDNDCKSESGDKVYWYLKLISKYEARMGVVDSLESEKLMKIKFILAMNLINVEGRSDEGFHLIQNIVESPVFQDLELLNPLRVQIKVMEWAAKFQGFENIDESTFDMKELENALKQAQDMYTAIVNMKQFDPLYDILTMSLFTVVVTLLTKIGKVEDAQSQLFNVISKYAPFEECTMPPPPFHYTLVTKYCQLLSHLRRNEEAISIMEKMYDRKLSEGNVKQAINALNHLVGFAIELECPQGDDKMTSLHENAPTSLWSKYVDKIMRLETDVYKSGKLLLGGDRLQLEEDVVLRRKFLDFSVVT